MTQRTFGIIFSETLQTCYRIIKQDKMIFVPCFILFLFRNIMAELMIGPDPSTLHTFIYQLIDMSFDVFIFGSVIFLCISLVNKKEIHLRALITSVINRYMQLLISTLPSMIPSLIIITLFTPKLTDMQAASWTSIDLLLLVIVFILNIIVFFSPIIVILENQPGLTAFFLACRFVKTHLKSVFIFLFMIFNIFLVASIVTLLFIEIPVIGKALFSTLIYSFAVTLAYITAFSLYIKKGSVSNDLQ